MNTLSNYHRILYLLNFFALAGLLVVNFLANFLPINGQTTGEVASKYRQLFNPADFTFGIWIMIYLGLILYIVHLINSTKLLKGYSTLIAGRLGIMFTLSCVANAGWVIAWHYEQLLTTIILIIFLLLSLIDINRSINKIENELPVVTKNFYWYVKVPFGVYLGWICIAVIANIAIYLVSIGWNSFGFPPGTWTIFLIIFGGFLGLYLTSWLKSFAPAIAIGWGIFGIFFNYWQNSSFASIQVTAICMMAMLGIGAAKSFRKTHSKTLNSINHD